MMVHGLIILLAAGILMLLFGLGYLLIPAVARRALPGEADAAGNKGVRIAGFVIAAMGAALAIFASVTWFTIS